MTTTNRDPIRRQLRLCQLVARGLLADLVRINTEGMHEPAELLVEELLNLENLLTAEGGE